MKIEHNEICLRDVTAADCKQLGKWWNDGSIMAHAGFPNGLGTTAEEIWEKKLKTTATLPEEGYDFIQRRSYRRDGVFQPGRRYSRNRYQNL